MTDVPAAFLLIGNGRNQKQSLGKAAELLGIEQNRVRNIFYARAKAEPSEQKRAQAALRKIAKHQIQLAVALAQADREFFDADISAALERARQASALAE